MWFRPGGLPAAGSNSSQLGGLQDISRQARPAERHATASPHSGHTCSRPSAAAAVCRRPPQPPARPTPAARPPPLQGCHQPRQQPRMGCHLRSQTRRRCHPARRRARGAAAAAGLLLWRQRSHPRLPGGPLQKWQCPGAGCPSWPPARSLACTRGEAERAQACCRAAGGGWASAGQGSRLPTHAGA